MNQTSTLSSAVSGWTLWQLKFFQLASNCCASNSSNLFSKGPKVSFGKDIKNWKQSHNKGSLQLQRGLTVLPEQRHWSSHLSTAALVQVLNHADLIRRECRAHCLKHSVSSIAQSWCTWWDGNQKVPYDSYKAEWHFSQAMKHTHTIPKMGHSEPEERSTASTMDNSHWE